MALVISPTFAADAVGRAKLPPRVSEPDEVTVPVSVRPFTEPVPPTEVTVPAPLVVQLRVPVPLVVSTWPFVPAPLGNVRVVSAERAAGAWMVRIFSDVEAMLMKPFWDATGPEKVVRDILLSLLRGCPKPSLSRQPGRDRLSEWGGFLPMSTYAEKAIKKPQRVTLGLCTAGY